ncbi:MAG: 16S rRNA (guanine(527)-N(7))-methyltransferase RsmG [Sulfurovum sp.]|nr:16S rRNA (guanine(527)-N(7))-methyltransferase RsmG [Sulfurovum sp.]
MRNTELKNILLKEDILLDENTIGKLERFAQLLHEWNQIHSLTGAKNIEAIYENILDSIYPIKFIDTPSSLLDVGTGAGFPGIVLGIAFGDTKTVLCEPLNKRASFLKYVTTELELKNISISKMKVEELQHKSFTMISSRAVTDTKLLLKITSHLSDVKTEYLFYKGSHVFQEIESSCSQLNYDIVSRNKRNYLWIKA